MKIFKSDKIIKNKKIIKDKSEPNIKKIIKNEKIVRILRLKKYILFEKLQILKI